MRGDRVVLKRGLFMLLTLMCFIKPVWAVDHGTSWGPDVGTKAVEVAAHDQTGSPRILSDLAGEQGLLLLLSRSVAW